MNKAKQPKFITRYQIYNAEGTEVLQPFSNIDAATYMSTEYFPGSVVIEIEVEV